MKEFCKHHGITAHVMKTFHKEVPEDFTQGSTPWSIQLRRTVDGKRKRMTIDYFTGPAITEEPTAADVFYCLIMDWSGSECTFEEWADELGYDTDSRKAERIFKAVQRQSRRLDAFADDLLEDAREMEH